MLSRGKAPVTFLVCFHFHRETEKVSRSISLSHLPNISNTPPTPKTMHIELVVIIVDGNTCVSTPFRFRNANAATLACSMHTCSLWVRWYSIETSSPNVTGTCSVWWAVHPSPPWPRCRNCWAALIKALHWVNMWLSQEGKHNPSVWRWRALSTFPCSEDCL